MITRSGSGTGGPAAEAADLDALRLRAELLAGQQIHEGGGTVNLSASEWLDRWRAFRRRSAATDIAEPHVDLGATASDRAVGPGVSAESREAVRLDDLARRFDLADSLLRAGRGDEAIATSRGLVSLLRLAIDQRPNDPSLRHRLALALGACLIL